MSVGIQFRRPKPTMQTAHGFFRDGSFYTGPEHRMTDTERSQYWDDESVNLLTLAKKKFPRGRNVEYAVLKGHLIIENALSYYIRSHSTVLVEDNDLRFSFKQKLEIAYLMGFGVNDPATFPTVERWNSVRNKVAHGFEIDRNLIDEMIRVNSEDYSEFELTTDLKRVSQLRSLCYFICGRVAGETAAHTFFDIARSDAYRAKLETK